MNVQRRNDVALPLGRQLREARRCARLTANELARKSGLSPAAVYNVERADRGGRTRTLVKLAQALGLTLRVSDLATLATERGLSEVELAQRAKIAFGTVRSILSNPLSGNVTSLEKLCAALDQPVLLVI